MTTLRHLKVGPAFRTRSLGLLGALATTAAACVTAPPQAAGSPLTYSFLGRAGAFLGARSIGIDTFDGTFVFDATPAGFHQPPTDVFIAVSGPVGPGFYGDASLTMEPDLGITFTKKGTDFPRFDFSYTLGLDALTVLGLSSIGAMSGAYIISDGPSPVLYTFPDAEGIRISIVPEPASLAMLGSALGVFLFALGRSRRIHRA